MKYIKKEEGYLCILKKINKVFFYGLILLMLSLFILFLLSTSGFFAGELSKNEFEKELMIMAYAASDRRDFDAEIAVYSQLAEKIPERNPEYHFKMGKAYYQKGDLIKATRLFYQALEEGYIDSADVYFNLALVAQNAEKTDIAIKYYKKVLDDNPGDYDVNFNLGNIYYLQKKNDSLALIAYQKAIKDSLIYSAYNEMLRGALVTYDYYRNPEVYKKIKEQLKLQRDETFFKGYDQTEFDMDNIDEIQAVVHTLVGKILTADNQDSLARVHYRKAKAISPELHQQAMQVNP